MSSNSQQLRRFLPDLLTEAAILAIPWKDAVSEEFASWYISTGAHFMLKIQYAQ